MSKTKRALLVPLAILLFMGAGCQTLSRSLPEADPMASDGPGVSGRVVLKGTRQPVQGTHIYAYTDYSKNLIGVADHVSKGSAEDGSYFLKLPPGEYYIVARKRLSGANYGPIVSGDLYDHRFEQQALKIPEGGVLEKDFELETLSEPMFFQVFTEGQRKTGTGVRGRVFDEDGEAVPGAFATAYRTSDMRRLPDFVSTLTADDGSFTLYLPAGGKWYIGARSHARGAPEPGELVGRYDGSDDHSLLATENSFVEGIQIILKPFSSQVPAGYTPY
ncbi:MAG: carboxypeptidase-like regulatory domain-containing protein [bacterium]|nr:carboxypeptidase-like regulatory domain-containing protein [bacterium]MDT8365864.1 carboxypeptidase-like regulatory domain-containing protein [bacterium]